MSFANLGSRGCGCSRYLTNDALAIAVTQSYGLTKIASG